MVAALPTDLVGLYERLAVRGPGAGLLRQRTCEGCRMVLAGTDLQTIRQAVEALTHSHAGINDPITISIGLAQHGDALPDRPTLMRAADEALYRAKQEGRNRVVVAG